jgi:dipeptidyl aminopeptidase/acylaminoacyl peptidase
MPPLEEFTLDVEGVQVRGVLHLPADAAPTDRMPAVLICRGVHVNHDDAEGLFDALTTALTEVGWIVATFEHRCADLILEDFHAHSFLHDIQDVQAVLSWLTNHPRVLSDCCVMIGYSLGAIAAAALCDRSASLAGLVMISPTTADHLVHHLTRSNGSPARIDPQQLPAAYLPSLANVNSTGDLARCDRPVLIVHGAADRFIVPEVSLEFLHALESQQRTVDHVLIGRADHTYSGADARQACVEGVARFVGTLVPAAAAAVP